MIELPHNEKTACVILSGGLSSRMKTHKALLKFYEHQNFLQQIIEVYQNTGIKKIIVVKNADIDFTDKDVNKNSICVAENFFPKKGRLYSIQLGLCEIPDFDYCFIQNIDNPFITNELLTNLYSLRSIADYISPEYNSMGGHPILISSRVIKELLASRDYYKTLRNVLESFSRHKLTTHDEHILLNINLPSDYEKLFLIKNKIATIGE